MLSERLRNFVTVWCDVDSDVGEVTDILRESPDHGFSLWLEGDLRQAIVDGAFTPELVARLTNVRVRNEAEVDAWLRTLWTTWFPGNAYPDAENRPEP